MDLTQLNPINLATFVMSATALLLSTLALFPGLRSMLAIFRDAVLWLALFLVLGAGGFLSWNHFQQQERRQPATAQTPITPPITPGFTFDSRTQP